MRHIDTITGTPCPMCDEPIGSGFAVFEDAENDDYFVICDGCDLKRGVVNCD